MKIATPPIRFLMLTVGGWLCLRALVVVPGWWVPAAPADAGGMAPSTGVPNLTASAPTAAIAAIPAGERKMPQRMVPVQSPRNGASLSLAAAGPFEGLALPPAMLPAARIEPGPAAEAVPLATSIPAAANDRRWTISAWLFVREGRGRTLAPGATLGGSQAGVRATYAIGDGVALSGRAYVPVGRPAGAEMAAGIDWRPTAALPVNLLAERRVPLGDEGRSAFALTVYGGMDARAVGPLRLDAYGQAGIVGMKRRDLFADGAARISLPRGAAGVGGGAWGAAQPGAARLDIGPQASITLPVEGGMLRLAADWRFRIAGGAAPANGPSLTLAASF